MKATACDAVAAEAKLSGSDAKRPILVHNQIVPLSQFVCDLKDAGILVGGFEKPGYFSSSSDYTLKLYVPEEFAGKMSPEMVGTLGSVLLGDAYRRHRPEPDDGNPFDFSAVEPSDSAAAVNSTVQKIVLREVEAFVGKTALVGVQIGDEAKLEAVSVAQWRQASAVLASLASVSEPSPNVCAAFKENASNLDLETAGQAMLFCGKT